MKLYYSPGACSQAPHILMHEIGIGHDAVRVDLKEKRLEDGSDFLTKNPKGSVPALELENGEVLTENSVILQFLGDRAGNDEALPGIGHFRRYRVLELVNFITTELHKRFAYLFNRKAGEETKALVMEELGQKLDWIDGKLGKRPFLMGDTLTIADPYLFVIARWTDKMIGLERWPSLAAFYERMQRRPSVQDVLAFEGLLESETAG